MNGRAGEGLWQLLFSLMLCWLLHLPLLGSSIARLLDILTIEIGLVPRNSMSLISRKSLKEVYGPPVSLTLSLSYLVLGVVVERIQVEQGL